MQNTGAKRKHPVRRAILWILLILVLALTLLFGYNTLREQYAVWYRGYTATTGSLSDTLTYTTSVQLTDSETAAATAAGTVRNVYVTAGDRVAVGDRLVRLSGGQVIFAETAGTVNSVAVREGDEVAAGSELVQIADFTRMKLNVDITEYDIGQMYVGKKCTVKMTATGETYESELASISYVGTASGSMAYYTATLYVTVGEGIYPGMQAEVAVTELLAEDAVLLDVDAISFDETNQAFVYLQGADGSFTKQNVTVGAKNDDTVAVTSGVAAGDTVYARVEMNAEMTLQEMQERMQ